jgi:Flp pilus assembly protein CpaB
VRCTPVIVAFEEGEGSVKRQTIILVTIGVVLFVAGGAIAFLSVVNGNKTKTGGTIAATSTQVLVATQAIPAGTTGQQMQAENLVAIRSIPTTRYIATDLTNAGQLTDTVLTSSVAKGNALQSTQITASTTAISPPPHMDVVTVTVTGVGGLAGYLQPGSHVDVYANITKLSSVPLNQGNLIPVPCTELAMANILVLDVSATVPALGVHSPAGGRTIPPSETLALAVSPDQSQTISFLTANEELSVVQTQNGTLPPVPGVCKGTGQYTVAP